MRSQLATVVVSLLCAGGIAISAARQPESLSAAAPLAGEDRALVERAIRNYIDSVYLMKPELVEESVHPELKKRAVRPVKDAPDTFSEMTREQLMSIAARANASGRWNAESRRDILVFDIDGEIACAKLTADGWVDYFHLAKMDDRWVIVNVLWAPRD